MQSVTYTIARPDTGAVLPYAVVTVYQQDGTTRASLFDAEGSAIGNPLDADINGAISFAALNGTYILRAVSAEGDLTLPDLTVQVFDLAALATAIAAGGLAGVIGAKYATKAARDADLAKDDGTIALVYADSEPLNNDLSYKIGSTGSGSWSAPLGLMAGLAANYATSSQAWAEGTEPGGSGTKSAKGWAEDAEGFRDDVNGTLNDLNRLRPYNASAFGVQDIFGVEVAHFGTDGNLELANGLTAPSLVVDSFPYQDAVTGIAVVDVFGIVGPNLFDVLPPYYDTTVRGTVLDLFGVAGEFILPPESGSSGVDNLEAFARAATFDVYAEPVITPGLWLAFIHGQSKSTGYHATPVLSTDASAVDYMLSGGLHTTYTDDFSAQTLAPLQEAEFPDPVNSTTDGETPARGFADMVHSMLEFTDGIAPADQGFKFVMAVTGVSGASASTILNPSTYYNRQLAVMDRVKSLAQGQGLPFTFVGAHINQGQNETAAVSDPTTWKNRWVSWRSAVETEGESRSGSRPDTVAAITQITDHTAYSVYDPAIARAIGELDEQAGFVVSCPDYIFQVISSSDSHYLPVSSKLTGVYSGIAFFWRYVKALDWRPLKPVGTKYVSGRGVTIPFHVPVRPLRLSTALVSNPGDYGFVLRKTSDNSTIALASVAVVGDAVQLVAAVDLPSQDPADIYVEYARGPASSVQPGPTTGARGCLCDSQGDYLVFDPDGYNFRLDNYSLLFRL